MDLQERAFRPLRGAEPEPARGYKPQDDGRRLVLAEHERRQPVAGTEAVAAADAALAVDRNAEPLERGDVAPDGAAVDGEQVGDVAAGHGRPSLEQLEQLQEA